MSTNQDVLTLELKNDDELQSVYEQYHYSASVWPEILTTRPEVDN
jgi:hypothetical protein